MYQNVCPTTTASETKRSKTFIILQTIVTLYYCAPVSVVIITNIVILFNAVTTNICDGNYKDCNKQGYNDRRLRLQ